MNKIEWTNFAEDDLNEVIEHIAEESIPIALKNLSIVIKDDHRMLPCNLKEYM